MTQTVVGPGVNGVVNGQWSMAACQREPTRQAMERNVCHWCLVARAHGVRQFSYGAMSTITSSCLLASPSDLNDLDRMKNGGIVPCKKAQQ